MSITVVPWYLQDEDHFLCRLVFLFFSYVENHFIARIFWFWFWNFWQSFFLFVAEDAYALLPQALLPILLLLKRTVCWMGSIFALHEGMVVTDPCLPVPGRSLSCSKCAGQLPGVAFWSFIWIRSDDSSVGWLVAYTFVATILSCFSFCWNLSPGNILGQALGGKSLLFLG